MVEGWEKSYCRLLFLATLFHMLKGYVNCIKNASFVTKIPGGTGLAVPSVKSQEVKPAEICDLFPMLLNSLGCCTGDWR